MKKLYEEPQLDIERFAFEDICDTSSGNGIPGDGGGDWDSKGTNSVQVGTES